MWDVRRILLILFENIFKLRHLYLQPQSCVLSNLHLASLVCFLIFIEYKTKKVSEKATAPAVAFIILLNSVLVLH